MQYFLSQLDVPTMALMSAVLFFSLTLVMGYTFLYRKTYPGFGFLTAGQFFWVIAIILIFYRVLGETLSIALGNSLLLLQGIFWYRGIAMYGEIDAISRRSAVNVVLAFLCLGVMFYALFIEYDTCRRVVAVSTYNAIVYGRIALEPYLVRRWRTYPMQSVFSGTMFLVACFYIVWVGNAWQAAHCDIGGSDVVNKLLFFGSMFLMSLLVFCLISMTSGRVEAELRETRDALRKQAQTDFLTGLPNRRYFLQLAEEALAHSRERGERVSLLMVDLDHFKGINDTYGHQAGDVVLRGVGQCLRQVVRDYDAIGRLGGEEFGVLLPGMGATEARTVAERLRLAVSALHPGGYAVTASVGVAVGGLDLDALLARADACLYEAKAEGRDRVMCRECLEAQGNVATG